MTNYFLRTHPGVPLLYYLGLIFLCTTTYHPLFLGIVFIGAFLYSFCLSPKKASKAAIYYPFLIAISCGLNALTNQRGDHVIATFLGRQITAESVIYGLCTGLMLCALLQIFVCINLVFTFDKYLRLFGSKAPNLALLFSMTLRFVPRLNQKRVEIDIAQHGLLPDETTSPLYKLGALATWGLESGIDTADSMRARGFGSAKRSSFYKNHWNASDICFVCLLLFLFVACLLGSSPVSFYPVINFSCSPILVWGLCVYCVIPTLIYFWEAYQWSKL